MAFLLRYKNQTMATINNKSLYVTSDAVLADYEDITSIENWYKFGDLLGRDYKYVRSEIKAVVYLKCGENFDLWDDLTVNEKIIACKLCIAPKHLRDSLFTKSEQYENSRVMYLKTKEARIARYDAMLALLFSRLSVGDAQNVVLEIIGTRKDWYIDAGVEERVGCKTIGLFDYIRNLTKSEIIPVEGSIDELVVDLLNILENGIY